MTPHVAWVALWGIAALAATSIPPADALAAGLDRGIFSTAPLPGGRGRRLLSDDGVPTYGTCSSKKDCPSNAMGCLQSKCTCPILFSGKKCEVPREPVEKWCLTPYKDWHTKGPKYGTKSNPKDFTRCAVVGSAGSMKGSGLGKEIDSHTAVFRFNEAPAGGKYAGDVGSFTTLRFQNRDRSGYAEKKGEICVLRAGKWYRGQDSNGKCSMQQMPTATEHYVDGHWKVNRRPAAPGVERDPGRPWFSNGFSGVAFAVHMCAEVNVYGFTHGTGYYFQKYRGKAKSWGRKGGMISPPRKALKMRHSWFKERDCLQVLGKELAGRLNVHSTVSTQAAGKVSRGSGRRRERMAARSERKAAREEGPAGAVGAGEGGGDSGGASPEGGGAEEGEE